MTLDADSRALVQQLVDALAPLTNCVMAPNPVPRPDTDMDPRSIAVGSYRKADMAVAAAKAALAATAGQ